MENSRGVGLGARHKYVGLCMCLYIIFMKSVTIRHVLLEVGIKKYDDFREGFDSSI